MPYGRPSRSLLLPLVLAVATALLLLTPLGSVGVSGQQAPLDADNTVTHIQVRSTGDATWTVQIRIRLDTDERLAEFEAYQERFRSNTSRYLDPFRERIRATVSRAANATGRGMAAENFTASTTIQEVPRRWGVVSFRFTWVGFADRRDGMLVVGDVFQGGYFLSSSDSLEITIAEGSQVAAVDPDPDERGDGVLIWRGREDFTDGRPRVVMTDIDQTAEPRTTTHPTSTSPAGGLLPGSARNRGLVVGGAVVVGLILLGTYAMYRRRGKGLGSGPTEPPASPSPSGAADHRTGTAEGAILTDAERVRAVLDAHGGRMKQAAIGDELEWSDSKVSRVVGDMVEDGSVEKLQLGRENLIELADDG